MTKTEKPKARTTSIRAASAKTTLVFNASKGDEDFLDEKKREGTIYRLMTTERN